MINLEEQKIKDIYSKIRFPEIDVKENVLNAIGSKNKKSKLFNYKTCFATAITAIILCLCIFNSSQIVSYAKDIVSLFTNSYNTSEGTVNMSGGYIKLNDDACKENSKYSSISEIEKMLGVKILKSPDAYEEEDYTIEYIPYLTNSKKLCGVMLINNFYIIGDLKNISARTFKEFGPCNSINFDNGKKFKSPVNCQIIIRSNNNPSKNYENHELEYAGENWNLNTGDISNIETYNSKKLGVKVLMYSVKTDGLIEWNMNKRAGGIKNYTTVHFVYNNIEYLYFGDISFDTMKEIVNDLNY